MYCLDCNHVYQTEDDVCPYCNSGHEKTKYKPDTKIKVLKSLRAGGVFCLLWIVILCLVVVLRKTAFNEISNSRQVDNTIFMYSLAFNAVLMPLVLSIYNLIISIKHKSKLYVVNFLFTEIFILILWIISLFAINIIDGRIISGYDRRQEVTGGTFIVLAFFTSIIVGLVLAFINQIILLFLNSNSNKKLRYKM